MKKVPTLLLTLTGMALLTGCASMDQGQYSQYQSATSSLAYTPVTSPVELSKWAMDFPNLQSIDTYVFTVPADGAYGSSGDMTVQGTARFDDTTQPGSAFVEAAGAESGPQRVIIHRPNQR